MGDIASDRQKFQQGWRGGLPETPCGSGSRLSSTVAQREWIPDLVRRHGLRTIADIGAGDLNWIRHVTWPPGTDYRAYDLVPRHPAVTPFDLLAEIPPAVDLLLCLWVLNHLPPEASRAAIQNLKASGSRYLLMTDRPRWHPEQPKELASAPAREELVLNPATGDRIVLVRIEEWQ